MKAREALVHIRTLISAAAKSKSIPDIRKVHREVLRVIEMGLSDTSNVVPIRRGTGDNGGDPKAS